MKKVSEMIISIYLYFSNMPYLLFTPLKKSKILIAYKYFTGIFLNQLLGIASIKIGKYKIFSFNGTTALGLFGEIFFKNEYYFQSSHQKPLIIDCGANIGMTTMYFKRLYPQSIIHSFEPNKKAFELLKKNIEYNNIKDVSIHQTAVSYYDGEIEFFDSDKPSFTTGILSGRSGEYLKTKVKCISFSHFLKNKKIDLLKMDIEGGEDAVLIDMEKNGSFTEVKEIILEYHHNIKDHTSNLAKILTLLEKAGYSFSINAMAYRPYLTTAFQDLLIHAKKID